MQNKEKGNITVWL